MSTGPSRRSTTAAATLLIALSLTATTAAGARSARPGQIAFVSDRSDTELFVARTDGSHVRQLVEDPGLASAPIPSPDRTSLAFASTRSGNGDVYVLSADGTGLRRLTSGPAVETPLDWSPDGLSLLIAAADPGTHVTTLVVIRPDGSDARTLAVGHSARWSPDASTIAFIRDAQLWVMGADGGNARRLTSDVGLHVSSPAWSADGSTIAFLRSHQSDLWTDQSVWLGDADGTHLRTLSGTSDLRGTVAGDRSLAWSTNGRSLTYVMFGPRYATVDPGTGKAVEGPPAPARIAGSALPQALGPGEVVYTRQVGGEATQQTPQLRQIYLADANGQNARRLTGGLDSALSPRFSPDGRSLAYITGSALELVDLGSGTTRTIVPVRGRSFGPGGALTFSPRGTRLAYANGHGIVAVDLRTLKRVSIAGRLSEPDWSPDGKTIVAQGGRWPDTTLWTMRADGTHRIRLAGTLGAAHPVWSPDGRRIAFVETDDRLVTVDAHGKHRRVLIRGRNAPEAASLTGLAWSPDGRRIAFAEDPDFAGNPISVIDRDGRNRHRLHSEEGVVDSPAWQPVAG